VLYAEIAEEFAVTTGDVHSDCAAATREAARLCDSLGHEVSEAEPNYDVEAAGRHTRAPTGCRPRLRWRWPRATTPDGDHPPANEFRVAVALLGPYRRIRYEGSNR